MEIIYHVKKKLFDLWLPRGWGRDGLGLTYANYYILLYAYYYMLDKQQGPTV